MLYYTLNAVMFPLVKFVFTVECMDWTIRLIGPFDWTQRLDPAHPSIQERWTKCFPRALTDNAAPWVGAAFDITLIVRAPCSNLQKFPSSFIYSFGGGGFRCCLGELF